MAAIFRKIISCILAFLMSFSSMITDFISSHKQSGFASESLSDYEVPEWFRDAKFGIFIHYGVYSVPAYGDEWYGHQMYIPGSLTYGGDNIYDHHLATYGGASAFGYKDFIPEFSEELKKFSQNNVAEDWAALFDAAGAKYVMPVGIHHDSFALYDSGVQTTYNSVTQSGVDYISELQKACKEKDIKFGISNHFVENDWFFDDAYAEGTDLAEKNADGSLVYGELYGDGESKSEAHIHKWYDISMEIINKYHPDIIYYDFDLGSEALNKYKDANRYLMLENYYKQAETYNPDGVVCCNKHFAFTQAQAVLDKERSSLGTIAPTPWQTDTSIGKKSWGYVTNEVYRSGEQFIGALVDIVSKNGNLLLNVGPEADGTIPDKARTALLTIGNWLSKYGDAIYCSRPWVVCGEGPTQSTDDSFTYSEGDIRFTKSKDESKLYITSLTGISGNTLNVKTLAKGKWNADTVESISLINGKNRTALSWQQTEDGLAIDVSTLDGNEPFSVEVTFKDGRIPAPAIAAGKGIRPDTATETSGIKKGHNRTDGSDTAIAEKDGAYIKQQIDFSDIMPGTAEVTVTGLSKGKVTFYDDDTNEILSQITVNKDRKNDYRTVTANISGIEKGEKVNIRVEMSGSIELSDYGFVAKRVLNEQIDASAFDEKSGAVQAEPTADPQGGGNSLGYVTRGDHVVYKNVDLGNGCTKLTVRAGAGYGKLRVYKDEMKKRNIIAECEIKTGDYNSYETLMFDITKVSGVHDIYIEFLDDATNLNWFRFSDR